jgi:hypothetical protein
MGIDTYLTVIFWASMLALVIRGLFICGSYPRTTISTLGQDVFQIIIAGLFFAWVCVLKFN